MGKGDIVDVVAGLCGGRLAKAAARKSKVVWRMVVEGTSVAGRAFLVTKPRFAPFAVVAFLCFFVARSKSIALHSG